MMSTEDLLRLTVAALMQRTGERQAQLGAALDVTQAQVSKKQAGRAAWTLGDVDRLAAHWGMTPLDLLAGPTHAASRLPADRITRGTIQAAIPLPTAPADVPEADLTAAPPTPAPVRSAVLAPAAPAASAAEVESAVPAAEPPATEQQAVEQQAVEQQARVPRRPTPAGPLADLVRAAVTRTLREHQGDIDAARAALIKRAIPDVMDLFEASRVGGRYEHSQFPPTSDLLQKRTQKGADQVWEARPKWRAAELARAAREGLVHLEVTALDANAAYLAALKTHLPIGKLVHSTGDAAAHDPKRSGIHRITPPAWTAEDLPSPLGARKEPGDLWVTEPTLRLLLHCARLDTPLCDAPIIHESWTSGSSEGLLEKMRRALVEVRKEAIANDDEVTTEYVKFMYSKFVSTIGESSANRAIRRPDWMHIIRSQAFANLWRKAHKAHEAGLTVVEMSGTDELHVAGDWRQVFEAGRDLAQVKPKNTYILGGDQ
ncbi:acyltransferase [Streptomyces sp. TS71-3]|uniref:acyltransferase n=1 Tax=Streptomyces sp. TS71-3 TaxID=2733862 RepID=UPI001B2671D7|nr:acyltransferase [Streptomyces sp. TS71-3]GHJ39485.1 hypothetical protein Sm713_50940 [Streptomyces sp. TS71-3]